MQGLAASLLIHGVFAFLALGALQGSIPSGSTEADIGVMEVSLEGLRGSPPSGASMQPRQQVASLLEKVRAAQSDIVAADQPARPKADLATLFGDETTPNPPEAASGSGGKGDADKGGNGASGATARAQSAERPGAQGGSASSSAASDLWGLVKPCWDRLPRTPTVPVTLLVTIRSDGVIAKPPTIVRPATAAPDPLRLVTEARAIAALSACMPYRRLTIGGGSRVFRLDFAKNAPAR